jgi:hypothetical protein
MRRAFKAMLMLGAIMAFGAVSAAAQSVDIDERGKSPIEAKFSSLGQIRMEICSSGVNVVGKDQTSINVSYSSKRDDGDVRVHLRVDGSRAELQISRCPNNDFQVIIEVPKRTDLFIRIPAGQLDVDHIAGNKDLEIHAGQINVELGQTDDYRKVDASVYTGEVDAPPYQVSKGGLFRSFERKGPGEYRLHVHVAAGQINLR